MSGQARCTSSPLDSPEVAAAKRLMDTAKDRGFVFERTGPGQDAPLLGVRESVDWVDEIVLAGFWEAGSCCAVRRRRSSLLVPGRAGGVAAGLWGRVDGAAHGAVRLGDVVSRPAQRWALSPLDSCVHLLPEGDYVGGVLGARCGHQLPTVVHRHDQPPPGPSCEPCRVLFLADFEATG